MQHALTVTGGVITSAGLVLAATFAVLAVLPLTALLQLGMIVAVGVLMDTLHHPYAARPGAVARHRTPHLVAECAGPRRRERR